MDSLSICYFSDPSEKAVTKILSGKQKPKQSVPLDYITEFIPMSGDKDSEAIGNFENFESAKAFKLVFYGDALINGYYDPVSFKKKHKSDEKLKKSKTKSWYLLLQDGSSAQDWIAHF